MENVFQFLFLLALITLVLGISRPITGILNWLLRGHIKSTRKTIHQFRR